MKLNIYRAQIIKSDCPTFWYARHIGSFFNVIKSPEYKYDYLCIFGKINMRLISRKDMKLCAISGKINLKHYNDATSRNTKIQLFKKEKPLRKK